MADREKEKWLDLSDAFFRQGDFQGMRACARELLEQEEDDLDGRALLAQASFYLGDEEMARDIVSEVEAADGVHLRALLVEGELYAGDFLLFQELAVLEKLISLVEELPADSLRKSDCLIWERALCLLADAYQLAGKPEKAAEAMFGLSRLVEEPLRKADFYSKGLFLTNYRLMPADRSLTLHKGYNAFFRAKVTFPHESVRAKKYLRIGYISPDFRLHAAGYFLAPFLQEYDKDHFAVFVYQWGKSDAVTQRFKRFAVSWRDISALAPQDAARQIYDDRIDILVDLSGHTQGSCLPVLACRPAPVQVSGIGYMNTTGLQEVDYFLSDVHCQPKDEMARGFTEKVLRLPQSHLCYAPKVLRPLPVPAAIAPCLENGWVTFGCFNNFSKVSRQTLLLWRAILEQVPTARLVLKSKTCSIPAGREMIRHRLAALSMDSQRIELRPYSPDYLEQYQDIDVALDTLPYNGGLTTCEALYMGVPVVTLRGRSHGARFGASLLENAGVAELIAESEMEYVKKAVQLAASPEILQRFHEGLRQEMERSALMDGQRYMKDMETAYQQIWQAAVEKSGQ